MTSPLDQQLRATHDTFLSERPLGADEDVHMVASIVDHVIERCSAPGDLVFDPFAGFGTTLERAVALDRRAIGIELLPERVRLMQHRMPWPTRIIEGDARELRKLLHELTPPQRDGTVDLILASPPYMTAEYHEADPLMAYERDGGDYARYLSELGLVAAQCARMVKPRWIRRLERRRHPPPGQHDPAHPRLLPRARAPPHRSRCDRDHMGSVPARSGARRAPGVSARDVVMRSVPARCTRMDPCQRNDADGCSHPCNAPSTMIPPGLRPLSTSR